MKTNTLFNPYDLGSLNLSNRIAMAPMTRSRAINNLPNDIMAKYYGQRASAGLIITEGVSPSPNGLGYARIPGIFSDEQVGAWRTITDAVHDKGGRIFVQLMHTGRVAHGDNLPSGAQVVAPSAVAASGKMWTDQNGFQEHPVPVALSPEALQKTKAEFVNASKNAIRAGFDGIELHSANGYLLEQFISPYSNQRTDEYGGNVTNRIRFVLEVVREVSEAIGKEKTGIRISPYGIYNDMPHYAEIDATYTLLTEELSRLEIAYLHLLDHSPDGAPEVPLHFKEKIRGIFRNTIIMTGGYNLEKAKGHLSSNLTDIVAFGKPFISNPDLVHRLRKNLPLNIKLDASTLYTPGEKGFTDYPVFSEDAVTV